MELPLRSTENEAGKKGKVKLNNLIYTSNILPDMCMSVCVSVSSSVVGGCEIDHWIALGVWSSAGGVVGSPSTPTWSNARFRSRISAFLLTRFH